MTSVTIVHEVCSFTLLYGKYKVFLTKQHPVTESPDLICGSVGGFVWVLVIYVLNSCFIKVYHPLGKRQKLLELIFEMEYMQSKYKVKYIGCTLTY